jgi:hypothetical protein
MATHYVGNYPKDSEDEYDLHRGWVIGKFMEESPRKNDHVEVKYWEFEAGDTGHKAKTSGTLECTFISKVTARHDRRTRLRLT